MGSRITERRLVDVLTCWARDKYLIAKEVPHFEKRIDMAYIDYNSNEICTIEAKTEDWRRAVQQAALNLTATNRSYIAIFRDNIKRVDLDIIKSTNIGLISVGTKWGDVYTEYSAPQSPYVNPYSIDRIERYITDQN